MDIGFDVPESTRLAPNDSTKTQNTKNRPASSETQNSKTPKKGLDPTATPDTTDDLSLFLSASSLLPQPEDHLILPVRLQLQSNMIETYALLDCGATSVFMDVNFARTQLEGTPLTTKAIPRRVHVIDGRPISSGNITQEVTLAMSMDGHHEKVTFDLCALGKYPIILGMTWLRKHNPKVDW